MANQRLLTKDLKNGMTVTSMYNDLGLHINHYSNGVSIFFLVLSLQSHCSFTVKSSQHYNNKVYLMNRWWLWTVPGLSTAIRLPQMELCMSLTVLSVLLEAQSKMSLRLMMTWQLWAWVATLKNKSNYTTLHRDSELKVKLCIGLQENLQDLKSKSVFFLSVDPLNTLHVTDIEYINAKQKTKQNKLAVTVIL